MANNIRVSTSAFKSHKKFNDMKNVQVSYFQGRKIEREQE